MTEPTPPSPSPPGPGGAYPSAPYTSSSYAAAGDGRMKLEFTLDFLYRQRLLILLCTVVFLAAAAAYAFTRTPAYRASSLVRVDLVEEPTAAPDEAAEAGADGIFATNDRTILAEVFLLQTSKLLRQRVAEQLDAEQPGLAEALSLDKAVDFDVADEAANTVLITATSADPQQAAHLANLFADAYVRLTQEAARNRIAAQRARLEEQEARQRDELASIEAQQRAQVGGGAMDSGQQAGYLAMQITNLEAQRDQARVDLQTRQASLRSAQADLAALEPQLTQRIASGDEQRLQDIQEQVAALRAERTQTEQRYPDAAQRDPRVQARLDQLDAEIRQLEAEAQQLSQRIIASGGLTGGGTGAASTLAYAAQLRRTIQEDQAVISALEGQLARLEPRIADLYAQMRQLPREAAAEASQQIARAQLERERLYAEQTYQNAASQLRDARAAEEMSTGYAHLIQEAQVPFAPTQIPASRFLLLGAFIGLSLGLGLAFVRDKMDNRILKPEQLREWGYPVLATIPNLTSLIEEEFGGAEYVEADGRRLATRLVTLLSPLSPTAEAYRQLRTNVLARPGATFPVKVLLVTSPGPEDGKSTTAANLAVALAQTGHRTLLLDADLRRPSVHRIFGIPRSPGLIQHLLPGRGASGGVEEGGEDGAPEAVTLGIDDLFVIPAGEAAAMGDGAAPPEAASVTALGSPATAGYLQWLREQFDFIVIDTPPVLATTDALQLARQVDAVVVTARAQQTREGELSHVLEALEQVGAPVVGTVLNGFDVSMAYGYKYRYRSYTEYGLHPDYGRSGKGGRKRGSPGKGKKGQTAQRDAIPTPSPGT